MYGLGAIAFLGALASGTALAQSGPTPEQRIVEAKRAAMPNFTGTFTRLCVAPENRQPGFGPPPAGPPPERASWYGRPYKVFDDLYFVGTRIHSAWALKTSGGIIIIDTLFDYAVEPEIVQGLKTLGLDPRDIRYVLISHAHGDHDQGAALLQSRYGAKIVMGAADWDATLKRAPDVAGGVPRRDIAVGPEGMTLTLGGTAVNVIATPGHTPGTLSYIFPVRDQGRTLTVAYSGGTAFNFQPSSQAFAIYEASQRKMAAAAKAAGARVLMSNHTEFDGAYDKARIAQLPRAPGEPHPYDLGPEAVQQYFTMAAACAQAQRLSMQ